MALVACRECGSEISDSATTCPRCGVSAPGGVTALTFERHGALNAGVKVAVFVDQQPFGMIRGRRNVVVPVTPGIHHIELRTTGRRPKSTVGTVEVSHNDIVLSVRVNVLGRPEWE